MLSTLIWVPIAGAILISLFGGPLKPSQIRTVALITASAILFITVLLLKQFDPNYVGMQFQESFPWIESLGLTYKLGVDGISMPLVVLNSLLVWVSIFSSGDVSRPRFYYALMLLLGGAVAGAFLSQNLLLFFLFYEVELIPLYLLIAIWGGANRGYAATKFLLYTAVSGILLLAAFFGIATIGADAALPLGMGFDLEVAQNRSFSTGVQMTLLLMLLVAFGIKIPLVPFHTWLPDAHVEASTPVSVLLAGVLLKLGTYGLLRFGLELFPEAWQSLGPVLATWAAIGVVYGCFTAITQTDMKKMVAFSSVGHMGYILLGLASATPLSITGVTFQMLSHGLISALMFLAVGVIYSKAGTRDLNAISGLLNPERGLPIIGSLMILAVMASAGIPGMVGFIAEFLVFRGSFTVFPVQTLLCMIGTGLTAVYFLILVDRAFFGRLSILKPIKSQEAGSGISTLSQLVVVSRVGWWDRAPSIILAVVIIVLGLQPSWVVRLIEQTSTAIALVV